MAAGYTQQMAAMRQQNMLQQQLAMGHHFRTPHPAVPPMGGQSSMLGQSSSQMPMAGMGQWPQQSPGGMGAIPNMSASGNAGPGMPMRMPGMAGYNSAAMMANANMSPAMPNVPGQMMGSAGVMSPPASAMSPAHMDMTQLALRRPMGFPAMGHDKMPAGAMASPMFQQQWLQARMMRDSATGAPHMLDEVGGASMYPHTPHNRFPPTQGSVHQRLLNAGVPGNILQHHRPDERRLAVEPVEEDDLDDEGGEKHLASARYRRNHLLLVDIFSDVMVPDPRPTSSEAKVKTIQQHYGLLEKQKSALENELSSLENNFSQLREKVAIDRVVFQERLDKVKEDPFATVLPSPTLPMDSHPPLITRVR